MTSRELVLAHFRGEPVPRLPLMPITMMFAGDLAGIPYGQYCGDYRKLVQAQLLTAERFGFDYVSCISDPTRETSDCGAKIAWFDNQPPAIYEHEARLSDKTVFASLQLPDPHGGGRMTDRIRAAALFKEKVGNDLLIEGWIEGPCAEGADLRGINNIMTDFFDDPPFIRDLFAFVVEMELAFARAQIDAGVDIIGMGDAATSLVGPEIYEEFVFPYEKQIVDGIHAMGGRVRLHICGNTRSILGGMGRLGCEVVDLDYPAPVEEARAQMGPTQVLLGNIDPVSALRNSRPEAITRAVGFCHQAAGSRFIVGAGCEIPRDTPHENVRALCEYARSHRP